MQATSLRAESLLPQGYSAARLNDPDGLREADALYRRVFGYTDPSFSLNPNLVTSLCHHGGSSVGVFDEFRELVGYAYGFAGIDDGQSFHFSQAAVVDHRQQGRGLGRTLKYLQAEEAARVGHREMRWTFDPLLVRNAHFNLDSLQAVGVGFLPRYFERRESDRILVNWELPADANRERCPKPTPPPTLGRSRWGTAVAGNGNDRWIPLPADANAVPAEVRSRVSERIAETLRATFDERHVLIGCSIVSDDTAAYLAVPRESLGTEQEHA
ncbi:MAG TPA: hypothetical protein H9830_08415 [Candidatus Agrococcus pullicola]|uniref:GNAT family N-acetyltransferase n=1 Tax=Candidatus Agrococcus pullicola TaxID=2838429 RepID=A0A9D1YW59_9MICO|nr:hypothetical protein [Candidatus Agrococcus pullicola]